MRISRKACFRLAVITVAALAVAACGSANISSMTVFGSGGGAPERVVVGAIVVPPGSVSLDAGVAARLRERVRGESPQAARSRLTAEVSSVLITTVVDRLTKAGLPATAGISSMQTATERTLLIDGTVTQIDEGNRTRRNVIGFGAGKSQVSADMVVSMADSSGRKQLLTFRAEADSGRRPGAIATAPVSAAQSGVAVAAGGAAASGVVSQKLRGDVEALARNLGDAIADRVIEYARAQGWLKQPG